MRKNAIHRLNAPFTPRHPAAKAALLASTLVAFLQPQALAQVFHLKGTMTSQAYLGQNLQVGRGHFEVSVDRQRYRIKEPPLTIRIHGRFINPNKELEYTECGSDGSYCYLLDQYDKKLLRKDSVNVANLTLYATVVPPTAEGWVPYIWQAYASGHYYKSRPDHKVEPAGFVAFGFREADRLLPAEWKLNTMEPYLPERVVEFLDGNLYSTSQNGPVQLKITQAPASFGKSITNEIYQVLSWTNYAHLRLPLRFHITRFAPDFKLGRMKRVQEIDGQTLSVSTNAVDLDFPPHIAKRTMVNDQRLYAHGKWLGIYSYLSSNGQLKSLSELRQTAKYRAMLGTSTVKAHQPATRWLMFGLVFILLVVPAGWMTLNRQRRGRGRAHKR